MPDGLALGELLGDIVGPPVGDADGDAEGDALGIPLGEALGEPLGLDDGDAMLSVGDSLAAELVDADGKSVGEATTDTTCRFIVRRRPQFRHNVLALIKRRQVGNQIADFGGR